MAGEARTESETSNRVLEAASYLVRTATAMQAWSGSLDWSRRLANQGALKTPALIRGFSRVPRVDFLPEDQKADEGYDQPLQVGHGQTNSQPTLVANMLELLKPRKGHAILDVGAGSGWTTALLASVAGDSGRVIGTERIPELVNFSRGNLEKYAFPSARIEHTESDLGMPAEAPFHRILVSAHMIEDWIPELTAQLNPRGGIMVAPIASKANHGGSGFNQSLAVITRNGARFDTSIAMTGVGFVPLIHGETAANTSITSVN